MTEVWENMRTPAPLPEVGKILRHTFHSRVPSMIRLKLPFAGLRAQPWVASSPSLSFFSYTLAGFLWEYFLSCIEILFSGSAAGEPDLWHLSKEYPWLYLLKLMLRLAVMTIPPGIAAHIPTVASIIVAMAPPWRNLVTRGKEKCVHKFWKQPLKREKLSKPPI